MMIVFRNVAGLQAMFGLQFEDQQLTSEFVRVSEYYYCLFGIGEMWWMNIKYYIIQIFKCY